MAASNSAKELKNEVLNTSETAKQKTLEAGSRIKSEFSERVFSLCNVVRKTAEHLQSESEPSIANQLTRLADYGDSIGRSLRDKSPNELYSDIESYSRRNPIGVLAASAAAGFLASRIFKAAVKQAGSDLESSKSASLNAPNIPETPFPMTSGTSLQSESDKDRSFG